MRLLHLPFLHQCPLFPNANCTFRAHSKLVFGIDERAEVTLPNLCPKVDKQSNGSAALFAIAIDGLHRVDGYFCGNANGLRCERVVFVLNRIRSMSRKQMDRGPPEFIDCEMQWPEKYDVYKISLSV